MKQKIVIKVEMYCGKCRKKAMKIAASECGVISVAIQGDDKDEIVVVGDGVDSAGLTHTLRKKVGRSTLKIVEQVKEVKKPDPTPKPTPPPCPPNYYCPPQYCCSMYELPADPYNPTCSIM